MSGHSKWANIKHKKEREDSKRGKVFTKLIKEITVAARASGDPAANPRLRQLIEEAKEVNMPKDNVERAIKKGTGELPGQQYEAITYEGYGPHGIAIVVETLTDNKNRTVAEFRRIFSTKGGNLGETGTVSWMFERAGVLRVQAGTMTEDDLLEKLMDFDIQDLSLEEGLFTITCDIKSLEAVKKAIIDLGIKVESSKIEWVPKTTTSLPDDQAEKAYEFLSLLDDHDDVQSVYTNLD